jgi:hypothetical protein
VLGKNSNTNGRITYITFVVSIEESSRKGKLMRYLLLIYQDEVAHSQWSEQELAAEYQEYFAFGAETEKLGVLAGDALMPTNTATTVRVRNGKIMTTDGPFAETKEQLGGYYLLDCDDLDKAIEIAARIPGARHGSIEIRPVMEFEQMQ